MLREIDMEMLSAAETGDAKALKAAVDAGARPKAKDHWGNTALMLASAASKNVECIKFLLPLSDPDALNTNGDTALMRAASEGFEAGASLLAPVSDQSIRGPVGQSALRYATLAGSLACVTLLAEGAGARPKGDQTETPLMIAAQMGRLDLIQAMLPWADPLEIDSAGRTALMWAVGGKGAPEAKERCVELLLPLSEAAAMDENGLDAVDWAKKAGLPMELIHQIHAQAHEERERVREEMDVGVPSRMGAKL
jgi:ankyrin repeat protein